MHKVRFSYRQPRADRRHYLNEQDVSVLLGRLPYETWERLRAVHFNDRSHGARVLGYVTQSNREIAVCALPPRISLGRFLSRRYKGSPAEFGACRGKQWSTVAVRRFLLYDVFLHELGHIQIVDPAKKDPRRKFAGEHKAEEFAAHWHRTLWKGHFDHPDPIHNRPSAEEFEALES